MAKKPKIIFIMMLLLLFAGCANQQAPGGGEIDRTPPQIIDYYPLNGTVNFSDDYIEFTFSEYVDRRSVQEAIFISPNLKRGFVYDWSGKTLTLFFKDTLKQNTTYTLSIGTNVADINNRNQLTEPVVFAFSTGDKIDKGEINGKVFVDNSDNVMVYAYQTNKEIDFAAESPDYVSQVGKEGAFKLLGLRDGEFKVLAVKDKLQNLLIEPSEDEYGIQSTDIILKDSLNKIPDVFYYLDKDDTTSPKISQTYMKDRNHLYAEFTEAVDSLRISKNNFYLIDTISQTKVMPAHVYKNRSKLNQYIIAISDSLKQPGDWFLNAENIFDKKGNVLFNERSLFTIKNEADTFAIGIENIAGKLPQKKIDHEIPEIEIQLNDAVDSASVALALSAKDAKGEKLELSIKRIDDAFYEARIISRIKQLTEYTFSVDASKLIDAAGNKIDTVYTFKLSTSSELDFSGVSGNIESDESSTVVNLKSADERKISYSQKSSASKFDFKKVLPGKYLLWAYKDKNKNGKYDTGKLNPFQYAEDFRFYPDTLKLLARWPVGDITIQFDKK